MRNVPIILALIAVLIATSQSGVGAFNFNIRVSGASQAKILNQLVLGSNTQWRDYGDNLYLSPENAGASAQPVKSPFVYNKAVGLHPRMMRYPGGTLADFFDWRAGQSYNTSQRGQCAVAIGTTPMQTVVYGTREFLEFCMDAGAEPLITVNIWNSSAQDAADWVKATNIDGYFTYASGKRLPRVKYWELGNEPYLKTDGDTNPPPPELVAQRINAIAAAMIAVDPTIKLGIPVRKKEFNGIPATHWSPIDFTEVLLSNLTVTWDFLAIHDAYLPAPAPGTPRDQLYELAMSAIDTLDRNVEYYKEAVARLTIPAQRTRSIKFAHTEFALFPDANSLTLWSSLGAGFYMANLWHHFAYKEEILSSNYWSLTSNGWFGLLWFLGEERPTYHVFKEYADIFAPEGNEGSGNATTSSVFALNYTSTSDTYLSVPTAGYVRALNNLAPISSLVVFSSLSNTVKVSLLNRSFQQNGSITIDLTDFVSSVVAGQYTAVVSSKLLYTNDPWTGWNISLVPEPESLTVGWTSWSNFTAPLNAITIQVPKHSLVSVRVTFVQQAPSASAAPKSPAVVTPPASTNVPISITTSVPTATKSNSSTAFGPKLSIIVWALFCCLLSSVLVSCA